MGPVTYSLCHKPIIGLFIWLTPICNFPPLVPWTPVAFDRPGLLLHVQFEAPVKKKYPIILSFKFADVVGRLSDKTVGGYNQYCIQNYDDIPSNFRKDLGQTIPIRIVVKKMTDDAVAVDQVFQTICSTGFDGQNRKYRHVGYISLDEGKYSVDFYNLRSQPDFSGLPSEILISSGDGK